MYDTEQFPGRGGKVNYWKIWRASQISSLILGGLLLLAAAVTVAAPSSWCWVQIVTENQRTTSLVPLGMALKCPVEQMPFGSQDGPLSASAVGCIFTGNTTIYLAFECFWAQVRALCNELFLCLAVVPVSWFRSIFSVFVQWALASPCRIFFWGLLIPTSAATWARTGINQHKCWKTQTKGFLLISFDRDMLNLWGRFNAENTPSVLPK